MASAAENDLRCRAQLLLRELLLSRRASEQRLAERGVRDPMKLIRGRSALDQAVAETEAMLDSLAESECAASVVAPAASHVPCTVEIEVKRSLSLPAPRRVCVGS